jgi:hypothetical protein
MISYARSDRESLDRDTENILSASIIWSADALPSRGKDPQHSAGDSSVHLLTLHDHSHILEKSADDLKRLRRGYLSLVLRESVQPLKYLVDVLLSTKQLFNKLFCIVFSHLI